jgi:cytoskeletal protein RodZ
MPEIDSDMFELLTLVLLVVVAFIGLAVFGAVGKLRRSIEHAVAGLSPHDEAEPTSREGDPGPEGEEQTTPPAASEPGTEASPAAGPERAAGPEVVAVPSSTGAATSSASEVAPAGENGSSGSRTEQMPAQAQPAAEPVAQDDPQDQPFERDGRWWFRRGDELLVHDEQSEQWVSAPQPAAATTQPSGLSAVGETHDRHVPVTEEAAESESFWKCPSCDALNGSTAGTCRMCFTARP